MKYKFNKKELEEIVAQSLSIADICRALNIRPIGGNYKTVKNKLLLWSIDSSHFTGRAWNVGARYKPFSKKIPLSEILNGNILYTNTSKLKTRLIAENIKENKCEECGLTEWRGRKISLELHHNNGNNMDNKLENLKILCPNCHSLTDTFRKGDSPSGINEFRKQKYKNFGPVAQ